jgi:N-sulfoglucosamine sulfohydrolase
MRAVQSKQFNYIFNPWAAGGRKFQAAGQGTLTYQEMIAKAEMDPRTSKLLKQYDYRVVEEFFDIESDPNNLNNLIDDPKFQDEIANHRAILDQWMEKTKDPIHAAFQNREDLRYLDGFVEAQQAQAFRRRDVERERNLK